MSLMRQTRYGVRVEGVNVVLQIGAGAVEMEYGMANKLAVLLRGCAKKAKRNAGDTSVKVIGFADLTDATLDELKAQRSRDGTAMFLR